MPTLWLDLETYSEAPIANGTYAYAYHPSTEITLFAYAVDDAPAKVWDVASGAKPPKDLVEALADNRVLLTAHNAAFDRTVLTAVRGLAAPLTRWRCTMARALAHSLPGGLDALCEVFKLSESTAKMKDSKQLVLLFCKPRSANTKVRRATAVTHPEQWSRFMEYARLDVEAMRAVSKKMPEWNYSGVELDLWHLDQTINDRGFAVDTALCSAAIQACDAEQARLALKTEDMTDGAVASATQRDKLLAYVLAEHGIALPDMRSSTLERRIDDQDLPLALRELLAVRLESTTTSTRKYAKFLSAVSKDGRMRGTLQYCGASRTGRWAGRLVQPQNYPRPTASPAEVEADIDALKSGAARLVLSNVIQSASNALRGTIIAAPGRKIVASDLSNIEGRGQAWLAGEEWKLQAFRDYDTLIPGEFDRKGNPKRKGHDLYVLAYAKSFRVKPEDVTSDQRQKGKVQELALGYEGGVGAFVTFAGAYGIDLDAMARESWDVLPEDLKADAKGFLEWLKKEDKATFGLRDETFIVCDTFKRAWRRAHPQIASYWSELRDVVKTAIRTPGETQRARRLVVRRDGAWLRVGLPSGRALCYPDPRVDDDGAISYLGINQYTRRWGRIRTYGGKMFENACQALARDVMARAMLRIETAGYPIVLTVHDEVITEPIDAPEFSAEGLSELLSAGEDWTEGQPLAAGGFEGYRYRKG